MYCNICKKEHELATADCFDNFTPYTMQHYTENDFKGYENLKCCGNCKYIECRFSNPSIRENNYCDKWQSDGMTKKQREVG